MRNRRFIWLGILLACSGPGWLQAQGQDTREIYQIASGAYASCCGFAGNLVQKLPNPDQMFVSLDFNPPGGGGVEMAFLGKDPQAVFMVFTNGLVSGNTIRFQHPVSHPYVSVEEMGAADYTVTNSGNGLRIDGSIVFPQICCDIPTLYSHTNLLANPLPQPILGIRVSQVELFWDSEAKRTYQPQYRSEATTNAWTNLGAPLAGTGSTIGFFDSVKPSEPKRFYRVLSLP